MPENLLIYRNTPAESILAARLVQNEGGETEFLAGNDLSLLDEVIAMIGGGAGSVIEGGPVGPGEGDRYFTAVRQQLARSTAWSAVRERPA